MCVDLRTSSTFVPALATILDSLRPEIDEYLRFKNQSLTAGFGMLIKTTGVILKKIPYSETSIITDIYTRSEGRMSCIISGVRKPRARVGASLLEVMSIVDLVIYFSDKARLNRIKEIHPAHIYRTIPFDVRKSTMLLFMAELCSKTVREEEPNEALYSTITRYLIELDRLETGFANLHLKFMISLADELGFGPSANFDPDHVTFDMMSGQFVESLPAHMHYFRDDGKLAQLIKHARGEENAPVIDRKQRNTLLDMLVTYFRLHIESLREIKSHTVIREVL